MNQGDGTHHADEGGDQHRQQRGHPNDDRKHRPEFRGENEVGDSRNGEAIDQPQNKSNACFPCQNLPAVGEPESSQRLSRLFRSAQRKVEHGHFRDRQLLMHFVKKRKEQQTAMGQDPYLDTPGN